MLLQPKKHIKEYIVTLRSYEELDAFYEDMETPGGDLYIPNRAVELSQRRPVSRNTHYMLTDEEAKQLANDPRVEYVSLNPEDAGLDIEMFATRSQTSSVWNKGENYRISGTVYNPLSTNMKNWGLLRCTTNGQSVSNWGDDGTQQVSGTVDLTYTGKNVDIVIIDGGSVLPDHPEFAVNADGTGGSRVVDYNWHQHNVAIGLPSTSTVYSYPVDTHPTHVAGIAAGNTQGWARSANIYSLYFSTAPGMPGGNSLGYGGNAHYAFDYVREFHRTKPINPVTGRKNPTIVNNSWGRVLSSTYFKKEWIEKVQFRGITYTPASWAGAPSVWNGVSGVYSDTTKYADFTDLKDIKNTIVTSTGTASVTTSTTLLWNAYEYGYTNVTDNQVGGTYLDGVYSGGYWEIALPFAISYLGNTYYGAYLNSCGVLTFGTPDSSTSGFSTSFPAIPKIMLTASAWSGLTTVGQGSTGSAGNRTYYIFAVGRTGLTQTGTEVLFEYAFSEANPNQITLTIGINKNRTNSKFPIGGGGVPLSISWGIQTGTQSIKYPPMDADVKDALADGIIIVASSGNYQTKIDVPGGLDWNNSYELDIPSFNPYFSGPWYYHQGGSPGSNWVYTNTNILSLTSITNIVVGNQGSMVNGGRWYSSMAGPGVDIYAPGTNVVSAWTTSTSTGAQGQPIPDPRSGSYFIAQDTGTSMSGPQVTGVLACALEKYPTWTPAQAKAFIVSTAKPQMYDPGATNFDDFENLFSGTNLLLYYDEVQLATLPVVTTATVPTSSLPRGQSITPFKPVTFTGGVGDMRCSISPALPTGLVLNTATGYISGTPA